MSSSKLLASRTLASHPVRLRGRLNFVFFVLLQQPCSYPKVHIFRISHRYETIVSLYMAKKNDNYRFGIFLLILPLLLFLFLLFFASFSVSLSLLLSHAFLSLSLTFLVSFFLLYSLAWTHNERSQSFARARIGAFTFYGACKCHTQNLHTC